MRFRRRDQRTSLEAELLSGRPQPSETFVRELSAQVVRETRRTRLRLYARVSFVGATTVAMFAGLAAFGGIGYAASSTVDAVKAAKRVVTPAKPKPVRIAKRSPAHHQYGHDHVTICHHTQSGRHVTITIARAALPAHLAHGDTIGRCD